MNYVTFQPSGQLDSDSVNQLRQDVIAAMTDGIDTILVDCQKISFMNSSGIGALVSTLKVVKAQQKHLVLCDLKPQVQMIFDLTRMDDLFTIYPNRAAFEEDKATMISN